MISFAHAERNAPKSAYRECDAQPTSIAGIALSDNKINTPIILKNII